MLHDLVGMDYNILSASDDLITTLSRPEVATETHKDSPNYWTSQPESLMTECSVRSIHLGNGLSIYQDCIIPQLLAAEEEVIIVTCFWARSDTLTASNHGLRQLSAKALRSGKKIRVRFCFSSSSLFQKLFHSPSLSGRAYDASRWEATLGLPNQAELSGLDMRVKSIFVLPFSVMHPKFVLIDRKVILLPSCNVSWVSSPSHEKRNAYADYMAAIRKAGLRAAWSFTAQ